MRLLGVVAAMLLLSGAAQAATWHCETLHRKVCALDGGQCRIEGPPEQPLRGMFRIVDGRTFEEFGQGQVARQPLRSRGINRSTIAATDARLELHRRSRDRAAFVWTGIAVTGEGEISASTADGTCKRLPHADPHWNLF